MNWKELIKPSPKKGIIFLALLFIPGTVALNSSPPIQYILIQVFFLLSLMKFLSIGALLGPILYIIVLVLYLHILSCIIYEGLERLT